MNYENGFAQRQLRGRLDRADDQQGAWCVQGLKESARRAAEFGVTLCVQNHHDIAAHYESMFNLLIEIDEPNCQAALDAWSLALHGTDLVAAPPSPAAWERGRG